MIFAYTLPQVLAQTKVQTSRIWKPDYEISGFRYGEHGKSEGVPCEISSQKTGRKLYYIGQILSTQPNRGAKGIARIRIVSLEKRNVRGFLPGDLKREGFEQWGDFMSVWVSMHDKKLHRELLNKTNVSYVNAVYPRPRELYEALVVRFELLAEQEKAA